MYIPEIFNNENAGEVRDFIDANSFGTIIGLNGNKIIASHIPLLRAMDKDGAEVLLGHIAKGNPLLVGIASGHDFLAIFTGAQAYISPSWYNHENVPTWNYMAVHVYGSIRTIDGGELRDALKKQTEKYEQELDGGDHVYAVSDNVLEHQIKGITGFELKIKTVEAVKKLSQNRDRDDYRNIITQLEKQADPGAIEIAAMMKKDGPGNCKVQ